MDADDRAAAGPFSRVTQGEYIDAEGLLKPPRALSRGVLPNAGSSSSSGSDEVIRPKLVETAFSVSLTTSQRGVIRHPTRIGL